jgi:hypothetical protein
MKPQLVQPVMCATCPFRKGSAYASLAPYLTKQALTASNRICHSTGSSAILGRTGKTPMICRGTRDIQLSTFYALKVIEAPTDEAWNNALTKLNAR